MDYTKEQVADITEREKKALAYLKELQLTPAASANPWNIGGDVFGMKIVPYLQDTKYQKAVAIDKKDVAEN